MNLVIWVFLTGLPHESRDADSLANPARLRYARDFYAGKVFPDIDGDTNLRTRVLIEQSQLDPLIPPEGGSAQSVRAPILKWTITGHHCGTLFVTTHYDLEQEERNLVIEQGNLNRRVFDGICDSLPPVAQTRMRKLFKDVW